MSLQSRITPPRAALIGAVVAAAIYCRDLRYDFILDDLPLILMNETITSWRNIGLIFRTHIFYSKYGAPDLTVVHYHPVYMLWLLLNHALFGKVLPWWHLSSLILHMGVTLLVYEVGVKVLKQPWTAALAALLFAFHPIHVEPVSYVSASSDLLAALFALVSFLLYFHFREQNPRAIYLIASVFAAALAILSKETGAMLPWMLVAYEALRENISDSHPRWKRFLWTLPYFAVVAGYAIARSLLFGHDLGLGPGGGRVAGLLDMPLLVIVYLYNFLWPRRLSFYYPIEWASQWSILKGVAVALVLMTAAFLWNRYRDRLGVRLQILWTAILFVPPVLAVSVFPKEDWIHDRHMYLVSIPLCMIVAVLLRDPSLPHKVSVVAGAMVLILLLADTASQVPRFSDELAIYQSALNVAPGNVTIHSFYANALWDHGRHEDALQQFRLATELSPASAFTYDSYASALAEIGRDQQAVTEYEQALRYASEPSTYRASVLYRLATVEVNQSKTDEAFSDLHEALQIDPKNPAFHLMLAQLLRQQGRLQEADAEMQFVDKMQRQSIPMSTNSQK